MGNEDTMTRHWTQKAALLIAAGTLAAPLAVGAGIAQAADAFDVTAQSANNGTQPAGSGNTAPQSDSADTSMWIKADGSQLSATVPTELDFTANGDGSLNVPTGAYIENNSIMPVHVSNVKTVATNGASIVTVADARTSYPVCDRIGLQITPAAQGAAQAGTPIELSSTCSDAGKDMGAAALGADGAEAAAAIGDTWSMSAADAQTHGTGSDSIILSFAGHISGFDKTNPNARTQFGSTTWTIAPGSASQAEHAAEVPSHG